MTQLRNFSEYEKIAKSTPVNILKANITKGIIEEGNSSETNIVITVYEHKSSLSMQSLTKTPVLK